MSISEADVRHVAALARVGVEPARLPSLVQELNGILAHMDVLQRVTIPEGLREDVGPVAMPLRADELTPSADAIDPAAIAPIMRDGFFLVPRLATHGAAGASADPDIA